jgi:hypothetical protein
MQTLPIMFILWALAVAGFTALMVYRAHLTQHETDQLFLSDLDCETDCAGHVEHDDIVRRVNRLRPYCQGFGGAAALITIAIVGVWVVQAIPNL